ncbi:hypothetical protein SAMN02910264_01332 [Ruminococcaceae bacterium YAD3003]|nr:hypothetical protein SAMN02910264_01332 [Ruminococcaceae bacterium YAD3003]
MQTEKISIYAAGDGRDKALELTEKAGAFCGLDNKSTLRLRLLSEEIIELIRPFSSELKGDFWLETNDENVEIHLKTNIPMDLQTRDELLSVATSGKNSAAKGLIGKIREMIARVTLPDDPETKAMTDQALGLMALGSQMGSSYGSTYSWSMTAYAESINNSTVFTDEAAEAMDALEKSIVANIADEVKVNIVDSNVEVVIYKAIG